MSFSSFYGKAHLYLMKTNDVRTFIRVLFLMAFVAFLASCTSDNEATSGPMNRDGYYSVGLSLLGPKAFPTTKYDTPFVTKLLVINDSVNTELVSHVVNSGFMILNMTTSEGNCAYPVVPAKTKCIFNAEMIGNAVGSHGATFSFMGRSYSVNFDSTAPSEIVFDTPTLVDFGTISAGQYRSTVIQIRNVGGISTVFSVSGIPSYALLGPVSCDYEIEPLESCNITLNYSPTVNLGQLNSAINIGTSDQNLITNVTLNVIPGAPSGTILPKVSVTEVTVSGGPKEIETLFVTDTYGNPIPAGTTGIIQFAGLEVEQIDGTPVTSGGTVSMTTDHTFKFRIKAPAGTSSDNLGEVRIISGSAEFFRSYLVRP